MLRTYIHRIWIEAWELDQLGAYVSMFRTRFRKPIILEGHLAFGNSWKGQIEGFWSEGPRHSQIPGLRPRLSGIGTRDTRKRHAGKSRIYSMAKYCARRPLISTSSQPARLGSCRRCGKLRDRATRIYQARRSTDLGSAVYCKSVSDCNLRAKNKTEKKHEDRE